MNFWCGLGTWILVVISITQYTVYDDWQAAIYFLVAAGFYAIYNVAGNAISYKGCNFIFSDTENKENKQE
jgi:hypothetical protein